MKISKQAYADLEKEIQRFIEYIGQDIITKHRHDVRYVNNQFISFCWAIFWELPHKAQEQLKKEDLTDAHIETALKRILAKYK